MKLQKHPNYFEQLLLAGGKIYSKLRMNPLGATSHGRKWEASAAIICNGYIFMLHAKFEGGNAETEEVAKANMRVESVIDVASNKEHVRRSYGILMLADGIYVPQAKLESAEEKEIRALCSYDTAQYIGMPCSEEAGTIYHLGYRNVVSWK